MKGAAKNLYCVVCANVENYKREWINNKYGDFDYKIRDADMRLKITCPDEIYKKETKVVESYIENMKDGVFRHFRMGEHDIFTSVTITVSGNLLKALRGALTYQKGLYTTEKRQNSDMYEISYEVRE